MKRKDHRIIILFFMIIFLIIFIYLSFQKLNQSYDAIINFLLKDFSKERIVFKKNFNYLISDYSFKEKENIIKEKDKIFLDHNGDSDLNNLLIEKLNRLGLKVYLDDTIDNNGYFIQITRGNNNDKITIKNKEYAKITIFTNNELINYLKQYFDNYYPEIINNISARDFIHPNTISIAIGGDNNNYLEIHNSTEIIALMLYDYFGDKK